MNNDEFRTLKKNYFDLGERKRMLGLKIKDFNERIEKIQKNL